MNSCEISQTLAIILGSWLLIGIFGAVVWHGSKPKIIKPVQKDAHAGKRLFFNKVPRLCREHAQIRRVRMSLLVEKQNCIACKEGTPNAR